MLIAQEVEGMLRDNIPNENESIYDDFELIIDNIVDFKLYKRPKEDCPFNRGNWIADILFTDGQFICLKLPVEMNEESIIKYFKPLIDDLDKLKKSQMN